MNVIVTDPYLTTDQVTAAGGRKVDLDELLSTANVISLHIPLTPATRHTINADAINTMRPGTLLINTARGGLITNTPSSTHCAPGTSAAQPWMSSTPRTPT